jgi:hypothetical protein
VDTTETDALREQLKTLTAEHVQMTVQLAASEKNVCLRCALSLLALMYP